MNIMAEYLSLQTIADFSGKQFIHPARIAITGRTVSPSFFETVSLVGKEVSVKRLRAASDRLKAAAH